MSSSGDADLPRRSGPTSSELSAGADLLGVDVGGTKALGVRLRPDSSGHRIVDLIELPSSADRPDVVDVVVAVVDRLLAAGGDPSSVAPALGVGLAGFVDHDGWVRAAPNAAGLVDVDVAGELRRRTGLDPVVDNDANCVAVTAHEWSDPHAADLVAVTLGTGIGGGVVVGDHLVRGARGFAGEPGHVVIDPSGPPCPCGQRGCWERYASGSALREAIGDAVDGGTLAADLVPGRTGLELASAVRAGAPGAAAVLDGFAARVATGIAGIIALLDPQLVAIGGGISDMGDVLLRAVTAQLRSNHAVVLSPPTPRIELVPLGARAGAVGAALLAGRRNLLRGV